jgi:DNA (cytosine-5)-methyltransferase 1
MKGLVLSIFPGIDLLGMAFEEAGFCVVRGPDLLWGGDIRKFHPPAGRFDGVIGGPPCQEFSTARGGSTARHGNLIPEFERVVSVAQSAWFVMENVPRAPIPSIAGYIVHDQLARDVWLGGDTMRLRRFSFGTRDGQRLTLASLALHGIPDPAATTSIWKDGRQYGARTAKDLERVRRLQGLPEDFSLPGFTTAAAVQAICNGVPFAMGRAVAAAVVKAIVEPSQ